MGLWEITLAVIFSHVSYAVTRPAVSVKLARDVVTLDFRPDWPHRNILEDLDGKLRKCVGKSQYWRFGLTLGDRLAWWVAWSVGWTVVCSPVLMAVICVLGRGFCPWYSLGRRPRLLTWFRLSRSYCFHLTLSAWISPIHGPSAPEEAPPWRASSRWSPIRHPLRVAT
jgi:hypothetical protein